MSDTEKDRHPFRFLFKLALFIGVLALITRFVASKKDEYYGLTESQAREKFQSTLGPRIGDDKAAEVADQVIPKLKEKGVIKGDVEAVVDTAKGTAADAADAVKDAADGAMDKAKDVADDAKDAASDAAGKVKKKVEDITSS